jgi:hypothetical protein
MWHSFFRRALLTLLWLIHQAAGGTTIRSPRLRRPVTTRLQVGAVTVNRKFHKEGLAYGGSSHATQRSKTGLRDLTQDDFAVYDAMSDLIAKRFLIEEEVLKVLKPQLCWVCGQEMDIQEKHEWRDPSFRCTNTALCEQRPRLAHALHAWLPFQNELRGGEDPQYSLFLRLCYCFGAKIPQDAARFFARCGQKKVDIFYPIARHVCAFTLQSDQDAVEFEAGVLEADGTKISLQQKVSRADRESVEQQPNETKRPKVVRDKNTPVNVHRGRFLLIKHRRTHQRVLLPMRPRLSVKGASSPPETAAEVKKRLTKRVSPDKHIVCADAGPGIQSALESLGITRTWAVHWKSHYTPLVSLPRSSVPLPVLRDLRKKSDVKRWVKVSVMKKTVMKKATTGRKVMKNIVMKKAVTGRKVMKMQLKKKTLSLPSGVATPRRVKLVGGSQSCESEFGVLKNQLRRTNMLGRSAKSCEHIDAMAAFLLRESPGMKTVLRAFKTYREAMHNSYAPGEAFKTLAWLTLDS